MTFPHSADLVGAESERRLPPLTVVMPTYNEGRWVERSVSAVRRAARLACWDLRIVVVDDGSDDPVSLGVLARLHGAEDVRIVRQGNQGRFAARAAGLREVRTPYTLLLDARVEVDDQALRRIRDALVDDGTAVWNLDVTAGSTTLGARFWTGITKVWWRDYFRNRRLVSFGVDEFDRFPKGTGAFFSPTDLLREALGRFESHFQDASLASDDTRLLREIARRHPIALTPEITCRHHNKAGFRQWARQCYYRGTTFVDGYLTDRGQAVPLLAGLAAVGVAGVALTVRAPGVASLVALAGSGATATATRWSGGTVAESASVGLLTVPFGALFGAGVIRGLRLAATSRE